MAASIILHLRLRASRGRQVHGHADCSSASATSAAATVTVCSEAAAGTSRAGSHGHGRLHRQRMRHTKAVYRAVTPTNSATAAHRRAPCRCNDGKGSPGAAAWLCAGSSGCSSGAAVLSRCSGIAVESPYLRKAVDPGYLRRAGCQLEGRGALLMHTFAAGSLDRGGALASTRI